MNFEQELNERFNSEVKMAETYPEYKEYLKAGFKVVETLSGNGAIIDIKVDDFDSNMCRYTVQFETGYTKNTCIKHKPLIEDLIKKQPPFNGKGRLFDNGMKYYKWGHFWEWSFRIRK